MLCPLAAEIKPLATDLPGNLVEGHGSYVPLQYEDRQPSNGRTTNTQTFEQNQKITKISTPKMLGQVGPGQVSRFPMLGTLNLRPHTHLELSEPSHYFIMIFLKILLFLQKIVLNSISKGQCQWQIGDLALESRKLLAVDRHLPNYIYLVVNVRMQPHFFFTALLRLWLELKCYQLPSFK